MRPVSSRIGQYVGLDVAMRNTGVIVYDCFTRKVVHTVCIQTESRVKETGCYVADDNVRCIRSLVIEIEKVLLQFPEIKGAFAELPHGGAKSSKAASMMSLAIGGVVGFLFARGIKLHNVSPAEVKHLVRPKGEVDKAEVQAVTERYFGKFTAHLNKGRAEHVADAAGALLAGLRKHNL